MRILGLLLLLVVTGCNGNGGGSDSGEGEDVIVGDGDGDYGVADDGAGEPALDGDPVTDGAAAGGDGDGMDGNYVIEVDPEKVGPACAIYTGCLGQHYVGACAMTFDMLGHYDLYKMTFNLAGDSWLFDWALFISMALNIDCILAAGSNCDQVLACMNQGQTVRNCMYLENNIQSRYCADENTLAACVNAGDEWYPPQITARISFRCDDFGMNCMESVLDGETWAACMENSGRSVTGAVVECSGAVANIFVGEGLLKYDCAFEGCACEPGTYTNMDAALEHGLCSCPVCDDQTYESRCEGNTLMRCSNGGERNVDCAAIGLVCKEKVDGPSTSHFCSYQTCDPMQMVETCTDGVIEYCLPDGLTTISCTDLGFSGCEEGAGCLE